MIIDLPSIEIDFDDKPLLVGGKAMEYYGLRKSGADIDLIASRRDFIKLLKKYSMALKDLYGDLGVIVYEFEIWKTIYGYEYDFLSANAVEKEDLKIIDIEKLLLMKASAVAIEKYRKDTELITQYLQSKHGQTVENLQKENTQLLSGISPVTYIEKLG